MAQAFTFCTIFFLLPWIHTLTKFFSEYCYSNKRNGRESRFKVDMVCYQYIMSNEEEQKCCLCKPLPSQYITFIKFNIKWLWSVNSVAMGRIRIGVCKEKIHIKNAGNMNEQWHKSLHYQWTQSSIIYFTPN